MGLPMTKITESREDNRYKVLAKTRALINGKNSLHVVDVSKSGICIRYVGKKEWPFRPSYLDVIYEGQSLIKKIPVQHVFDDPLGSCGSCTVPMRRRSLKFLDLTNQHKKQLQKFIESYTTS